MAYTTGIATNDYRNHEVPPRKTWYLASPSQHSLKTITGEFFSNVVLQLCCSLLYVSKNKALDMHGVSFNLPVLKLTGPSIVNIRLDIIHVYVDRLLTGHN